MNCEFLRMKHSLEFEIRFKHSSIHLALLCIVEAGQACADAIIHLYSGSSFPIYKDKKRELKKTVLSGFFQLKIKYGFIIIWWALNRFGIILM